MPPVTLEKAQAAKKTALRLLETVESVVGVGITRLGGNYAVKVNLSGPVAPGTLVPQDTVSRTTAAGSSRRR